MSIEDFDRHDEAIDWPIIHVKATAGGFTIEGSPEVLLGRKLHRGGREAEGIFAGWRWDGETLTVENDRFGFFPLYYFASASEVAVSPSIEKLVAAGAPTALDDDALAVFLRIGFFLGEETPFASIRTVPPDAEFRWTAGGLKLAGRKLEAERRSISLEAAIDAYIEVFRGAMERIRPEDPNYIHPLSGGRDSRHIFLELVRMGHPPRLTLTSASYPTQFADIDDIRFAAMLSRQAGIPHQIFRDRVPRFRREMTANRKFNMCVNEHAWSLAVMAYLNAHARYCYDGLGGDILSTAPQVKPELNDLIAGKRFEDAAEFIIKTWGRDSMLDDFLTSGERRKMGRGVAKAKIIEELKRHADSPNPGKFFYFANRIRRVVAMAPLLSYRDVERLHFPFLDREVTDFLFSLPPEVTYGKTFHNGTIQRAFPEFASIPFAEGSARPSRFTLYRHRLSYGRDFATFVLRHRRDWLSRDDGMLRDAFARHAHPARSNRANRFLPIALYLLQLDDLRRAGKR